MNIEVKLYATFREYGPTDLQLGESFRISLEKDTLYDLIKYLKIPLEKQVIAMINGLRVTDLQRKLKENDLIVFFPPLGGG